MGPSIRLGQTNGGDNETLKTFAGANRRFCCGGFDFQKRDDFCPINQLGYWAGKQKEPKDCVNPE
jgi:hypothetical protein